MKYFLGIDFGRTTIKSALVSAEGKILKFKESIPNCEKAGRLFLIRLKN